MKLACSTAILLAGQLLAAPACARTEAAAGELSAAARSAGLTRLAMAGFEPAAGAEAGLGVELDETMLVALLKTGRVKIVERSMVPRLMRERSFERSGAVEAGEGGEGRLAPAEALVLGRYWKTSRGVRFSARLVELRTGLVVAAAEGELLRERSAEAAPAPLPAAYAPRPAPAFAAGCVGAAARIDELEESVLELKARYWAGRLRKKDSSFSPGGQIADPGLRARFEGRLHYWMGRRGAALNQEEVRRFVDADREAFELRQDCPRGLAGTLQYEKHDAL